MGACALRRISGTARAAMMAVWPQRFPWADYRIRWIIEADGHTNGLREVRRHGLDHRGACQCLWRRAVRLPRAGPRRTARGALADSAAVQRRLIRKLSGRRAGHAER